MLRLLAALALAALSLYAPSPAAAQLMLLGVGDPASGISYTGPCDAVGSCGQYWGLRAATKALATALTSSVDVNCNGNTGVTFTIPVKATGPLNTVTLESDCPGWGAGTNSAHISQIYAQVGSQAGACNMTQATAASQPLLLPPGAVGGLPGVPTMSFNGSQSLATLNCAQPDLPITTSAVAIRTGGTVAGLVWSFGAFDQSIGFGDPNNILCVSNGFGSPSLETPTYTENTWISEACSNQVGTGVQYLNGTQTGTFAAAAPGAGALHVGIGTDPNTGSPLTGGAFEIINWFTPLNATSVGLVTTNQRAQLGF